MRVLFVTLIAVGWLAPPAATQALLLREVQIGTRNARYAVWLPAAYDSTRAWPAIVYLHGAGESGTDGEKPTRVGLGPALRAHPERWPFVVVFPQKPSAEEEWEEREDFVFAAVEDAERTYRIDRERVTITGMSQGGHGAWYVAARHPEPWSSIVPICGYGRARTIAGRIGLLPVWAFHGLRDDLVLPEDTRQILKELRARRDAAGLDSSLTRLTFYPEANHNSWDAAYAEPELPRWMLARRHAGARR